MFRPGVDKADCSTPDDTSCLFTSSRAPPEWRAHRLDHVLKDLEVSRTDQPVNTGFEFRTVDHRQIPSSLQILAFQRFNWADSRSLGPPLQPAHGDHVRAPRSRKGVSHASFERDTIIG